MVCMKPKTDILYWEFVITSYSIHYTKLYDTTRIKCIRISGRKFQYSPHRIAVVFRYQRPYPKGHLPLTTQRQYRYSKNGWRGIITRYNIHVTQDWGLHAKCIHQVKTRRNGKPVTIGNAVSPYFVFGSTVKFSFCLLRFLSILHIPDQSFLV